jgi:hypothetical protein
MIRHSHRLVRRNRESDRVCPESGWRDPADKGDGLHLNWPGDEALSPAMAKKPARG